jgi:hypothetical protein
VVREPVDSARMIYGPFFEIRPAPAGLSLPQDAKLAAGTELLTRFYEDYLSAKHPVPDPAAVKPPRLTVGEVDRILEQIELWNLRR